MDWELTKMKPGVSLRKLGNNAAFPVDHGRDVVGLHPRLMKTEYPMGETPRHDVTFINHFMAMKGDFPKSEFRAL